MSDKTPHESIGTFEPCLGGFSVTAFCFGNAAVDLCSLDSHRALIGTTGRCSQAERRGGSGPHAQVGLPARTYPPLAPLPPRYTSLSNSSHPSPLPSIPVANRRGSCELHFKEAVAARTKLPGGDSPPLWCLNPGRKGHLYQSSHRSAHLLFSHDVDVWKTARSSRKNSLRDGRFGFQC